MRALVLLLSILAVVSLPSCTRSTIQTPERAMREVTWPLLPEDDLEFSSLLAALSKDVAALQALGDGEMIFGPRRVRRSDYVNALNDLLAAAKQDPTEASFRRVLRERFEAFEVYGGRRWGEIFLTSYYAPVIEGAKRRTTRFSAPLYGVPRDLVNIDLTSFVSVGVISASSASLWRGRLLRAEKKGESPKVVALPDRAAIDAGALRSDAPVLAWVDPIDAFFLQIQGSGRVRLEGGGELTLGYAEQNGHPYVPIGRFLSAEIPPEKMSQGALEAYLRALPSVAAAEMMERNPSFVFFKRLSGMGRTQMGAEVEAGRTIATDAGLFPKGALAFLSFSKPRFTAATDLEPAGWDEVGRFVLDQDTGGAIRGPGRVDLFWGEGPAAKQAAGVIRGPGRLIYFVPRPVVPPPEA
jgi:membrane-bound lytic murein transglycosylase A